VQGPLSPVTQDPPGPLVHLVAVLFEMVDDDTNVPPVLYIPVTPCCSTMFVAAANPPVATFTVIVLSVTVSPG